MTPIQQKILDVFDAAPTLTSARIAEITGAKPSHVRKVICRNDRHLMNIGGRPPPKIDTYVVSVHINEAYSYHPRVMLVTLPLIRSCPHDAP